MKANMRIYVINERHLDLYRAAVSVGLVVPLLVLLRPRDPVQLELAQRVVRPRLGGEGAAARRCRAVRVVEGRLREGRKEGMALRTYKGIPKLGFG